MKQMRESSQGSFCPLARRRQAKIKVKVKCIVEQKNNKIKAPEKLGPLLIFK
ncbi:hypothetical protein [Bartonella acomydis]|uniref:hypothetical protein n=1 Tax=Bartonella acomydis TaxID=686234 RepID=UPI0031E6CA3E